MRSLLSIKIYAIDHELFKVFQFLSANSVQSFAILLFCHFIRRIVMFHRFFSEFEDYGGNFLHEYVLFDMVVSSIFLFLLYLAF